LINIKRNGLRSKMIKSMVQIAAILLTLASSVFLFRSNLGLTPETILQLGSTKIGYNTQIIKSLSTQTADTKVGAILLIVAVALQLVSFS